MVRVAPGAAVSLAACDVVVNSMEGGKAKAVDQWAKTYTMSETAPPSRWPIPTAASRSKGTDGTTFDVKAEISVRAGTEEAARELLKQVEIREESASGRVRLETQYPKGLGRSSVEVKYILRVPRSAKVDVETVNGGIDLTALTGTRSRRNDQRRRQGAGPLRRADGVNAPTAASTSGWRRVARTASASRRRTAELSLAFLARRKVRSRRGWSTAGSTVADLPVEKTESSRRKLEGTLNGGGPAIKLETVNGGIHVRRS